MRKSIFTQSVKILRYTKTAQYMIYKIYKIPYKRLDVKCTWLLSPHFLPAFRPLY